jgi:hypothetical protein
MSRLNITTTTDEILQSTNGGKDIFEKELGKIGKKCISSPLRNDKNPSFSIFFSNNGLWMYKDFSNGDSGTAIKFLQLRYNLDYKGVLNYIKNNNFVLNFVQQKPVNFINKTYKNDVIIDFTDVPFSKKGHEYWNSYELNEDFLKKNNVFQVGKYAINKKLITHEDDRVIFAYLASDERVKLLQIGNEVKKSEKWKSNVKADYLWYYEDYVKNQCNNLIVSKSVKDSLVLKYINRCSIAVQSENAKPIIDNCIDRIETITKNIYVGFGSDKQAKEQSHILTKATGWKHINTKDKYLDKYQINDFAELVKIYNMKKLDKELKEKNL